MPGSDISLSAIGMASRASTQNTWYSGTPEPDQYPDNEPGYVLSVTLEGSKLAGVEKLRSSEFTWVGMARAVHSVADLALIKRDLEASATSLGKTLVQLTLTGHLSLNERATLDAWRQEWNARLRVLDLDDKALAVNPEAADFEALGLTGPLLEAARQLAAIGSDANSPQQAHAATALLRLAGFAAEARHEAKP